MKESAFVGKAIETLQKQEELTQEQLALELNVSTGMVSHYKNNRRKMYQDVAQESLRKYDDPIFHMRLLYEFSGGLTPPVLDGEGIIQSLLAFKDSLADETAEAFEKLKETKRILRTPLNQCTPHDLEEIDNLIIELDDMETFAANTKMWILNEYKRDLRKIRETQQVPKYISRKWMKQ